MADVSPKEVERWLNLIYRDYDIRHGRFHLARLMAGKWHGQSSARDELAAWSQQWDTVGATKLSGIYLAACTVKKDAERGRTERDMSHLFGVWSDIDIAGPGHKHDPSKHEGLVLPPDQDAARSIVTAAELPEPTVWVHSGGGLYAWWLLEEPVPVAEHVDLVRDWQRILAAGAKSLGYFYGTGVGDPTRVLRLPGTVNRKVADAPALCRILSDDGPRYGVGELADCARDLQGHAERKSEPRSHGPEGPGKGAPEGEVWEPNPGSPLDVFEAATGWPEILEPAGWTLHRTSGCERYWTRPGKEPAAGLSMSTGVALPQRDRAWCFSDAAGLPQQVSMTKPFVWACIDQGTADPDMRVAAARLAEQGFAAAEAQGQSQQTGLTDAEHEKFWTSRNDLAQLHDLALRRRLSPWALLAATMARVVCLVGPHVKLPPVVGKEASLNQYYALVSPPGGGKSAALDLATKVVDLGDVPDHEVGTGQGVTSAYVQVPTKSRPVVQFCDSAMFIIDEVDSLAAHANQSASNLLAVLKSGYMAARIGARYAGLENRRSVEKDRYRMAVVAGVQPARGAVLLDDTGGGFPQRWVWIPALPPLSEPLTHEQDLLWELGKVWTSPPAALAACGDSDDGMQAPTRLDPVDVSLPDHVTEEIRAASDAYRPRGFADAGSLEGHRILAREKLAATFALMDGWRTDVTDKDWQLAGTMMSVSDFVRGQCQTLINREKTTRNQAKAKAEAERANTVEDITAEHRLSRVANAVQRAVNRAGKDGVAASVARRKLKAGHRGEFEPALEKLTEAGLVSISDPPKGYSGQWLTAL